MKLKRHQKDSIVATLTAVTFKDRVARKVAEEERLAMAILNSKVTPAQREAMDSLPANFFDRQSYVYATAQREGASNLYVPFTFPAEARVPAFLSRTSVVIEDPALDVVGILLKPSTWISGGILALCVWALINYGGN